MARGDHPGPDLIAYLDGELSPEAVRRVEAHLASCPACAAELEELRRLRAGVDTTLATALSSVRLSRDADDRIRAVLRQRAEGRSGWLRQLWGQRLQVAQAVLALVLVLFSASALRVVQLPAPAPPQETLVLGQDRFAPGSQAALRVIVRMAGATAGAAAAPAVAAPVMEMVDGVDVVVKLLLPEGDEVPLFQGKTGALGTADVAFTVPEIAEGAADLVVETRSGAGVERIVRPVEIARSYKLYLMTDKPAYRPGQTIHLRALALDGVSLRPASGSLPGAAPGLLRLEVADGLGGEVATAEVPLSPYGVAVWDVDLPPDAGPGTFKVSASLGDTSSERAVTVADYQLPPFEVRLETARPFYAPGDTVTGVVSATYFYGLPVSQGEMVVRAYGDGGTPFAEVWAQGDEAGAYPFTFDLPGDFVGALVTLEAQVVDEAGRVAGRRNLVPVSEQGILIQAMPESGRLKPGVENLIYLMTSYPDGTPAAATLDLRAGEMRVDVETGPAGLGVFRFTPAGATTLSIAARDQSGAEGRAEIRLDADLPAQTLLLHTGAAAAAAGSTLRATALLPDAVAAEAGGVYLDVVRAGQMVATLAAPVSGGRATFDLDLDPTMVGALALRAYALLPEGDRVEDTRLVVVDPARDLDVRITADQARYGPGDVAQLAIETVDGVSGAPLPAVIGLSVVDASVFALDTLPPGFARAYFLTNETVVARRDRVAGLDLPRLVRPGAVDDGAREAAQDLAARAAWAGASVDAVTLSGRAVTTPPDASLAARQRLGRWLVGALTGLPLVLVVVVVQRWRRLGLLRPLLKRLGWGLLAMVVVAPLLVAGLVVGLLLPLLGAVLFFVLLGIGIVLLAVVIVHGWVRHDLGLQFFGTLLTVYGVLAGMLLGLAARGIDLGPPALIAVIGSFLILVVASILQGQGVVMTGRRAAGWLTTGLALILVLLAVTAPAVPSLRSGLTTAAANPALYVGPLGWLSGCAAGAPMEAPTSEDGAAPTEAPAAETETGDEPGPPPTQAPYPTATPPGTPAPPTVPAEPYPLRQIFPETLLWAPELETGSGGRLSLELPLADTITAWRVTALASTLAGDVGAGSLELLVRQDLFVDITPPPVVRAGERVTLTLGVTNLLPEAQTVRWEVAAEGDAVDLVAPAPLTVGAGSSASTVWVVQPAASGPLTVTVAAVSDRAASQPGVGDHVQLTLQVAPAAP